MADNEKRIKAAGIRMAMKMIPQDLLDQAPATLEKYLLKQLTEVDAQRHETEACYLIAKDKTDGGLRLMIVTMDENCAVDRIVKKTTLYELFRQILGEMKEL